MATKTRRGGSTWVDEGVAHYLDRHPLADDRVHPTGAPLAELVLADDARREGHLPPLAELPGVPLSILADPRRAEAAQLALFVNYFAGVVSAPYVQSTGELLDSLGAIDPPVDPRPLERLESGFLSFLAAFGDLARRLLTAKDAYGRAITRLRSSHHRFFDVATAGRHRETARLHRIRETGGRPPPESEFLRDAPAKIERSFNQAVTRTTLAAREIEAHERELFDPNRWRRYPQAPQQALDAVRSLRQDAESIAGRAAGFPQIRRKAGDLRTAATYSCSCLEEVLHELRLPPEAIGALEQGLSF